MLAITLLALVVCACSAESSSTVASNPAGIPDTTAPISPVPRQLAVDPAKAALGRLLYNEKRLSRNGRVSCATCHDLATGGTDRRAVSRGIDNQIGRRNAPTVFNAALNFRQFWDGRAATLEEQAGMPILNPIEMGSTWPTVLDTLRNDPGYASRFAAIYPDGVTPDNVRDAIAAFERTLLTPDAPFDAFLRGDTKALSPAARAGWSLFRQRGCVACHQGVNIGGNLYQTFGVMAEFQPKKSPDGTVDLGRYEITHRDEDRNVFKVPTLRNVARTAPYFHDGSAKTLPEAVRIMGRSQLGIELSRNEVNELVAFLNSLTGRYEGRPL
jgi:cytochrome c peroxidase